MRHLSRLFGECDVVARVFRMAGEFQAVQADPWPLRRDGLDEGPCFEAVRAGERPEEIQVHDRLAVRARLDPGGAGVGTRYEQGAQQHHYPRKVQETFSGFHRST
ncbi:MAG: hypothetical protein ACLGG6_08070 [Gammaproteobacteria bacterium]